MFKRCLAFFILSAFICRGQLYFNGQNPSSTKWRQINTNEFQILFPEDFATKANELADYISAANRYAREYIKSTPKKITVILQNNTTVDNGFVTLAPWRTEFYAVPSQENEGVEWLKKLAIHEYRHVVQIEKFNKGLGKVLFALMGEQGLGALIVATTPLWYIEGDAVSIETRHTAVGRGEYGPFLREFNAQVVENEFFSYEKASFGSFKEYVTDHYKLGYFLVEHIKEQYGEEIIDSVLTCVRINPFVPFPFSFHLQKLTGKTTVQIYKEVVQKIKENQEVEKATLIDNLTCPSDDYVNFFNPVVDSFGGVYCFRETYDDIVALVYLKDQNVKRVKSVGRIDRNSLNYAKGRLVWAEKRRDPRWQYRDYSEIIVFNCKSKKKKRIKKKTRWFSPCLDPIGERIVVVSVDKANLFHLKIIDFDGNTLFEKSGFSGAIYHPRWEGDEVIFTELKNGISYVRKWTFSSDEVRAVFNVDYPISYPRILRNGIVAQVSWKGKDQIFYYKQDSVFTVINPKFGLQFFDVVGDQIYYSDYHSQGSRIGRSAFKKVFSHLNKPLGDTLSSKPKGTYEIKKYYPLLHLFNIHSWAPFSFFPETQSANLGVSMFSQNLLSSSIASFNYDYDWFKKSSLFTVNYEFSHFYPSLIFNYQKELSPNSIYEGVATRIEEESVYAGVKLNLLYDNSSYLKFVNTQMVYVNSTSKYKFEEVFKDTVFLSQNIQHVLAIAVQRRRAKRNIYPKYSILAQSRSYYNLLGENHAFYYRLQSTLPGILPNQGLRMQYEEQISGSRFVPNYVQEPLGYLDYSYEDAKKIEVEYVIPVWYPDIVISHLAYFQRLKMSVFYERMWLYTGLTNTVIGNTGVSIDVDFNALRYSYLTTLGVDVVQTFTGNWAVYPTFTITY